MSNIVTEGLGAGVTVPAGLGGLVPGPIGPVSTPIEGIRFMGNNFITDVSMITMDNFRPGTTEEAQKDGSGSAAMTIAGTYDGNEILKYIVEIDGVGSGEVGSATFKWSDNEGASYTPGVLTASTPVILSHGIMVQWASGTGQDFYLADKWTFWTSVPFGPQNLLDGYKRPLCDVGASSVTFTIDLGLARHPRVLCLMNHNFSEGVTITLKANATDYWVMPSYSSAVSYMENNLYYTINIPDSDDYRYWRVIISGNASDIQIGEMYIGDCLAYKNFYWPVGFNLIYSNVRNEILEVYNLIGRNFTRVEAYTLRDFFKALWSDEIEDFYPVIVYDPDTPDRCFMCKPEIRSFQRTFMDRHDIEVQLMEIPEYA